MENKTQDRTHWKVLTNPDYIGAYTLEALQVKELVVEITKVQREIVKGEGGKQDECTVAHLKTQLPFILNKTNCKVIEKIYGTPFIQEWTGKKLTLYVANVKAFGDTVPALRIKPKAPSVVRAKLHPKHERWEGARKALLEGSVTLEDLERNYSLSDTDRAKIQEGLI